MKQEAETDPPGLYDHGSVAGALQCSMFIGGLPSVAGVSAVSVFRWAYPGFQEHFAATFAQGSGQGSCLLTIPSPVLLCPPACFST